MTTCSWQSSATVLLVLWISLVPSARAQTYVRDANLDNSLQHLSTCVEPTCNPGGNPIGPTAVSSQIVGTTPCGAASDGAALELSVSGPGYVNALWSYKIGAMNNATHFQLDFDVCFDSSIAGDQAFESDIALFVSGSPGTNYMFGGQCNLPKGIYQVWTQDSPKWVDTGIPCTSSNLRANTWIHFQREVHFESTQQLWFDNLCIGQRCYGQSLMPTGNAGPLPDGWESTRIWQFQLDLGAAGGTTTAWLNNVVGKAWQ